MSHTPRPNSIRRSTREKREPIWRDPDFTCRWFLEEESPTKLPLNPSFLSFPKRTRKGETKGIEEPRPRSNQVEQGIKKKKKPRRSETAELLLMENHVNY